MWFKRRKRSEQDHALSESLRSLQTLINDTDRVEPSLAPRAPRPEGDEPGAGQPPRRPPRRPPPAAGEEPASERGDIPVRPARDAETGNRWKDLNLSFDAEPTPARDRRSETGGEQSRARTPREAPTPPAATGEPSRAKAVAAPVPATDQGPEPSTAGNAPGSGLDLSDLSLPPSNIPASGLDLNSLPDSPGDVETSAPGLDLEDFSPPPAPDAGLEVDQVSGQDDHATDVEDAANELAAESFEEASPSHEEDEAFQIAPGVGAEGPVATDTQDAAGSPADDEPEENQLHLELEPSDANDDNIPTLTDAVYVPDAPSEDEAGIMDEVGPPGPDASPYDERVESFLESVGVRLELMGVEAFSGPQTRELRDALVELLEEMARD